MKYRPSALAACLAMAFTLAGCQSLTDALTTNNGLTVLSDDQIAKLSAFKAKADSDLDSAEALAVAQKDVVTTPCYPAMKQFFDTLPDPVALQAATKSGVFTTIQAMRPVRNSLAGGLQVPDYLLVGCGPWAAQLKMDVAGLITNVVLPKL